MGSASVRIVERVANGTNAGKDFPQAIAVGDTRVLNRGGVCTPCSKRVRAKFWYQGRSFYGPYRWGGRTIRILGPVGGVRL